MTGPAVLEVLDGALATIQDAGRPGCARVGVPPGGACDPSGFAIANALLDNPPNTAAVEVALGGFACTMLSTGVIAIGGADLGAIVVQDERALDTGACHLVLAGRTVRFGGRSPSLGLGARTYIAVPGGFDAPLVLGSASTSMVGGFGGLEGRGLRVGDVLRGMRDSDPALAGRQWPGDGAPAATSVPATEAAVIRVVAGPHEARFAAAALGDFLDASWTVRHDSDRMGIRLAGPEVALRRAPELMSLPMTWGAIQVPADGSPIVLLADHQTVGGYPVLAVAIRADRPVLGQLAPGDRLRFELVSLEGAQAAWRDDRARFAAALHRLATNDPWNDQWRWAGG